MSKFSTRKGLGFAAVLALGASLFSGVAPANAAVPTLVPTVGDAAKTDVLVGTTFSLSTSGVGKFEISSTTPNRIDWSTATGDYTGAWTGNFDNNNYDVVNSGHKVEILPGTATAVSQQIAIAAYDAGSVSVRAYNGTSWSTPVVINFDSAADAGLTAGSLSGARNGTKTTATWTFASKVNVDEIAWSLGADNAANDYTSCGAVANPAGIWGLEAGVYKSTGGNTCPNDRNEASVTAAGALQVVHYHNWFLTDGDSLSANLLSWNEDTSAFDSLAGSWVYGGVVAQVVGNATAPLGTLSADVNNNNVDGTLIRKGTKSITVTSKVTDNTADAAALANTAVEVNVHNASLSSGHLSVGGKTIYSGDASVTFDATTDANGVVSFALASSVASAGDSVEIDVTVGGSTYSTGYFEWASAVYTLGSQVVNSEAGEASQAVVSGSTATVTYQVRDQWGAASPAGYIVKLTRSAASGSNRSDSNTNASWTTKTAGIAADGTVTFSIADNGSGAGKDQLTADLYTDALVLADSDVDHYLVYNSASALAATTVTADDVYFDGSSASRYASLTDLSSYRAFNEAFYSNSDFTYNQFCANGYRQSITGQIKGAAGLIGGALVTIAGTGAAIQNPADGDTISARNTLSAYSNLDGDYEFVVCSDKPGKNTFTITSGSATKTVDVYFMISAAKTVTLSANGGVATTQSGRSVAVTATVKDANGYAVPERTVSFSSNGQGAFDSATATTDANGVATVHYLTGVAETGAVDFTATVKKSADSGDTSAKYDDQADAVASAKSTVSFIRANGDVTHHGKTVTAKWSAAAGQKVIVTVDGYRRYTQVEASDNSNSFAKKLGKGRHVINLYIGGVLVDSLKFTIKK
jgi:adhesin/invasin